jgi:hypothetical protein
MTMSRLLGLAASIIAIQLGGNGINAFMQRHLCVVYLTT